MDRRRNWMRRYNVARNILGDLSKLVGLGVITKNTYNKVLKSSPSNQKKFLKRYSNRLKPGEIKDLKKKVREISKVLEGVRATHIHRVRSTFNLDASVNSMVLNSTPYTIAALESAMANLRYFNPATNALVTADPSTGTYNRELHVKEVVYKITARNNYQVPCRLTLYGCRPKVDTNTNPATYFQNGLADQGNPSNTSPLVHLTDSLEFKDGWKIEKSKNYVLQPGEEVSMYSSIKSFDYDFSFADTHASSFQPKLNGFAWVQRVEGILGHDTVADEQGFLQASCDFALEVKYVFDYDAGKDLYDISISDGASTFSNAGVVSNKPVSDNQQYSKA